MKSLFKSVAIIVIFSVLTRTFGFIFRIYLSRSLGAETLGLYQIAFSFFMVLCTLVTSGIPLVISRLTAKYRAINQIDNERKMISCALVISTLASLILCVVILCINKALGLILTNSLSISVLLALLPALLFSAIYSTFKGALWGTNAYLGVCSAELFEQVFRIALCVLFIQCLFTSVNGAIVAGISLSIACLFSALFIAIIYFAKGNKLKKPVGHYKEIIKISAPITGVRVATSLIQPLIAVIIPFRLVANGYTSAQAIGQYGIASGMTMPLLFIPASVIGALAMVLIPDLSTALAHNDKEHISNRISSSIVFTLLVSFLFIPLYVGAGENIGLFFFNNIQSGSLLASSAWLMIPLGLTNITSSILNALGLENKSLKNYIIGAILMLLSLWFLPKYIGIKAIIWAMGSCVTISSFLNIIMLKKHSPDLKITRKILIMSAITLPAMAITSFITNLLSNFIPLFFNLAISCSFGALFFILLCVMFNVVNLASFIQTFKAKFNNTKALKRKKKKTRIFA